VLFTVQLSNSTGRALTLALSAEDFTYLNQNGAIRFVEPDTVAAGAHGLAEAIRFDHQLVSLSPGQTVNLPLQITHPDQLAPGGHYAAIVYREVDPTTGQGIIIGVKPAVASLLFASTAGRGSVGLRLTTPILQAVVADVPATVDVLFTDTGNTQTSVHGLVRIYAPAGQLMAQGVINTDSGLILPAAERLFSVTMSRQGDRPWWPGMYELEVLYRHDGQATYSRYVQTFSYIDGRLAAVLGLTALAAAVVALRRFGPGQLYLLKRGK
jgi:hypothetical protein